MFRTRRSLICVMISLFVLQSQPTHANIVSDSITKFKNLSTLQMALIGAATVGSAVLGKIVYDLFFGLSDLEEIEQTLTLLENAQSTHTHISAMYYTPCTLYKNIDTTNPDVLAHNNSDFKQAIKNAHTYRPFLTFVADADSTCSRIKNVMNEIASRKIRIFDRKIKVIKNTTRYDELTKKEIIRNYNSAISRCTTTQEELITLYHEIFEARNYVIRLAEYEQEYANARIEALEQEVRQLKLSWPRPCNHMHYHIAYAHALQQQRNEATTQA